jgi:hypothetical protein
MNGLYHNSERTGIRMLAVLLVLSCPADPDLGLIDVDRTTLFEPALC